MRKIFFISILLTLVAFVSSCRSSYIVSIQPELEQVFIGKTYADIVDVIGVPDRIMPDGKDGQVLVYEEMSFFTDGHYNRWSNNYESITQASKGFIHLYMNPSDVCYNVRTNREREESKFSLGKTIGLVGGIGGGILMLSLFTSSMRRTN